MQETALLRKRSETDPSEFWDVESVYPTLDAAKSDLYTLVDKRGPPFFPALLRFKGQLQGGVELFKECVETLLDIERRLDKIAAFASHRNDEDVVRDETKALFEQVSTALSEFHQERSFFVPELLAIPQERLRAYTTSSALLPYRHWLDKIVRMRPHTLSDDKELLLAMATRPLHASSRSFYALNNADLTFPEIEDSQQRRLPLSQGLYQLYLHSSDRTLRRNAFFGLHSSYMRFENTLTEALLGSIEGEKFLAKARGFSSSLAMHLYPLAIPESVYHHLIASVNAEIGSLHKYIACKKRLLALSDFHIYDLSAPLVSHEWHFSKEEAIDTVIASVAPLGASYQADLSKGLKQGRWVDWPETEHKRTGAYSGGSYDTHPFILMNFRGSLRDLFTLAHEAGHSMHSLLANRSNPYQDHQTPIFLAEIASTLNEALLFDYLLKQCQSKKEQIDLLQSRIDDLRSTFFRQTLFAEFELALHRTVQEGTPLTPKSIKQLYTEINQKYFGEALQFDPIGSIEWARIPHFYYHFYVYQYATGTAAALALSEEVLKGCIEPYLSFLSSGGRDYPIELLRQAGIDMTLPTPVTSAMRHFDTLVDRLNQLVSK